MTVHSSRQQPLTVVIEVNTRCNLNIKHEPQVNALLDHAKSNATNLVSNQRFFDEKV